VLGYVVDVDHGGGDVDVAHVCLDIGERELLDGEGAEGVASTARGRPAPGYYTKRSAEGWLSKLLDEARRGELPGMVQTGAMFADATSEYMRWLEHDRQRKPSTLRDYQSIIRAHLLPAFGRERLEDITTEGVERWSASLAASGRMNNRTRLKILTVLHGVMQRARDVGH
jgi:hypothetical protein